MNSNSLSHPNAANELSLLHSAEAGPVVSSQPAEPPHPAAISGYRLIERIGRGGYGEVWRAEVPGGLSKAVKIIHGQASDKHAAEERKSLERIKDLRHPFLLSLERIEIVNDQLIIVTELADSSLKDRFDACCSTGKPGIPRDELLGYLSEAADALDFMNGEHGLQHLDVKPDNLLLIGRHVKVADFGLVKSLYGQSVSMVGGLTPLFAAPENFDGHPSDRSDQYSLAVVYQLLLTGKCPFEGNSMAHLASQHLHGRPNLEPLPESDRQIIGRALSKDPFDRFENCQALVDRLANGSGRTAARASQPPLSPANRLPTQLPGSAPAAAPIPDNMQTEVVELNVDVPRPSDSCSRADTTSVPRGQIKDGKPVEIVDKPRLQPTLFIGLGSCGGKALRALLKRLSARFGSLQEIPAIRFLFVDTDYQSFQESFLEHEDRTLSEREFLHLPLKHSDYYRSQPDSLTRWLSRRWLFNIPKNLKTESIRPLGRLALIDHVDQVASRLAEEIAPLYDLALTTQSAERLNLEPYTERPRIVLFGSASSGTGGGMVWDLLQLIRQALPDSDATAADLQCALVHWSSTAAKDLELSKVNTCALLKELNHYAIEGAPGDPAAQLSPVPARQRLFDKVYLVDLGTHASDVSFADAADKLAEFLDVTTASAGGEFNRACMASESTSAKQTALRTFSVSRLSTSCLQSLTKASRELAELFLARWIGEDVAVSGFTDDAPSSTPKAVGWDMAALDAVLTQTIQPHTVELERGLFEKLQQPQLDAATSLALREKIEGLTPSQTQNDARPPEQVSMVEVKLIAELIKDAVGAIHTQVISALDTPGQGFKAALRICLEVSQKDQLVSEELEQEQCEVTQQLERISGMIAESTKSKKAVEVKSLQEYFRLRRRLIALDWIRMVSKSRNDFANKLAVRLEPGLKRLVAISTQLSPSSSSVIQADATADSVEITGHLIRSTDELQRAELLHAMGCDLAKSLGAKYQKPSTLAFHDDVDFEQFSTHLLKFAQFELIGSFIDLAVKELDNSLLHQGGCRRLLLAAPRSLQNSGLVQLLIKKLPAQVTIVDHDRREILLMCDGSGLDISTVAWQIAQNRPEFIQLAGRLSTRSDVSWLPLA